MLKAPLVAVLVALSAGTLCADSVPSLINYQGKLYQASGAPVPDGAYKIALSIYDVPTGGTAIWTETQNPVVVKGSAFHALLGSVNPIGATIFSGPDRYLGVKLGDDPELSPRQRIASVPYAMVAGKAAVASAVTNGAVTSASLSPGSIDATKLSENSIPHVFRKWHAIENGHDFEITQVHEPTLIPNMSAAIQVARPSTLDITFCGLTECTLPDGAIYTYIYVNGQRVDGPNGHRNPPNAALSWVDSVNSHMVEVEPGTHNIEIRIMIDRTDNTGKVHTATLKVVAYPR